MKNLALTALLTLLANTGTPMVGVAGQVNPLLATGVGELGMAQTKATITEAERAGLLFMREEEQVAFDVYNAMAKKWGSRPFGNIARAEQTHMDAVKGLLDRFGIPDPVPQMKPGVYKNPDLQKLHDDFVKAGLVSRVEALKVGATIEDLDIFDLQRMGKETSNPEIKQVYANLERGSRNHLRAFVRTLRNAGATYKPKYISQAEFDKIIAGTN